MAEYLDPFVTPGLVDPHVHLREPGRNRAETIASGTKAALLGGYALIGDMPNTPRHPTWTEDRLLEKHALATATAHIPTTYHVGSQPESDNVGQLEKMAQRALWLKLYGAPTTGNENDYEASDFKEIVKEWHRVAPSKPIGIHAGKDNLEDLAALIAGDFKHPLHIHHVNSRREVHLARQAARLGWEITTGVCPHHLLKTSHDERTQGWFARMQPPLASQGEAAELMRYLANGLIDIIETDHAPHPFAHKFNSERDNPDAVHDPNHATCFGVPGIEFAAPLMFYQAYRDNISFNRVIDAMSTRPAAIMGVKLDNDTRVTWDMRLYRVGSDEMAKSAAHWTPYLGCLAIGVVNSMRIAGRTLVHEEEVVDRDSRVITQRDEII